MEQVELVFNDLTVGYDAGRRNGKAVARDLAGRLEGGRLTCLIGRNGMGKSTLLRTLAGLQAPLQGEVSVGGRLLHWLTATERARLVGVVLTDRTDAQNLTVEEVVALGRSPYTGFWGTLRQEDRDIVGESMERVGIAPLSRRLTGTLSDGERQKVMIAKALAQQTPVILLDEPTAFLDYPSKSEIFQLLSHMAHELHKTILLSTHDVGQAAKVADTMWLLDRNGLATGSPQELCRVFGADVI